ncbi:MAG TPA: hypothetical protein ENJ82_16995 [Bacteroidetes bacterium]|nr:hypothetical protein [Bacteroidota bacterium]
MLLPILLLFLAIGYFLSKKVSKELKKALTQLKAEAGKHKLEDRKDLKELFLFADQWLNRHRESVKLIKEEEGALIRGFKREYLQLYSLIEEIHQSLHSSLYVNVSNHSFSEQEIEDYSDFFGSDEDYEEDTFLQLNKNA